MPLTISASPASRTAADDPAAADAEWPRVVRAIEGRKAQLLEVEAALADRQEAASLRTRSVLLLGAARLAHLLEQLQGEGEEMCARAEREAEAIFAETAQEARRAADLSFAAVESMPRPADATLIAGPRIELQVARFSSFGDVNAYLKELRALPGVRAVKVRRFHRGVLFLSVDYEGVLPLSGRLAEISCFRPRHIAAVGDALHVALGVAGAATGAAGAPAS